MSQIIGIVILIIVLALLVSNVRIVPQAHANVIERLGRYKATSSEGTLY